jgi:hypothetical protein
MFNIYTYKNFEGEQSISRIGFPHSSDNEDCSNLSERLCDPNHCDYPGENVPDIIGMNATPFSRWDSHSGEEYESNTYVIFGITKENTFFVGIFSKTTDMSKPYSYEAVYENSVYFIKFYDESELIVSKSGTIDNFIFELKDDDDSFSYSWVACFNDILLFFRIDKKFLECVRYSEAEECEISQWFESKKPWYRINRLYIFPYTRDIFFSNLYFRRFANSFSIELNNEDDKLTINCELNLDGRSVKNSIKILKQQSNGDTENSYEGIRFEEKEEKEPESSDSEEEVSDSDSDDSTPSGSMHLKQIVFEEPVCSTYESTESPKTEEFSMFENFMNFMKRLLD